jgi:hypothetical protein
MIRNNRYWMHYIREGFIPEINAFADCLMSKILPAFENLNDEAEKIEQEELTRLGAIANPDSFDMGDIAEMARDRAVSHYLLMTGMFQGIINLFTTGLYHMFEQQFFMLHRRELLTKDEEDKTSLINMCKVAELLRASGIEITSFSSWSKIDELRLVANTVKHADGYSADKLKCCRPDLFINPDPVSKVFLPGQFMILRQVFQPLTGKDLFVTVSDLSSYVAGIKQLWFELADALEKIVVGDN